MVKTPVLLIVYNRPEITFRSFKAIRESRPASLFVSADGPQGPHEAGICKEVRKIATNVDWPCDLHTQFLERNAGCASGVIKAIDWVFESVEEAIIIEDDIITSPDWFRFCDELLPYYKGDTRIATINGCREDRREWEYSYHFSDLICAWGWATWRSVWHNYDRYIRTWPKVQEHRLLEEILKAPLDKNKAYFNSVYGEPGRWQSTWDHQLQYMAHAQNQLSIVPKECLTTNIGFGPSAKATHTPYHKTLPPIGRVDWPLKHPPVFIPLRRTRDCLENNDGT